MTDLASLSREVRTRLGPHVGIGVTDPLAPATGLLPDEAEATAGMRDKRLRGFAAGRCAARRAMSMTGRPLGFDDVELASDGPNFTAHVCAGQGGPVSTSGTVIQAQDLFIGIVVMQ